MTEDIMADINIHNNINLAHVMHNFTDLIKMSSQTKHAKTNDAPSIDNKIILPDLRETRNHQENSNCPVNMTSFYSGTNTIYKKTFYKSFNDTASTLNTSHKLVPNMPKNISSLKYRVKKV